MRSDWMARYVELSQDAGLAAQATSLAQNWLKDRSSLPPGSRSLVLRSAAFDGDRAYFDALVAAVVGNTNRRERADIYAALGSFRAPALAQAARELWLSPDHDLREIMSAGRSRGRTEALRDGVFAFLTEHFDAIAAKMPKESVIGFPRMFQGACSAREAQQLERFFTPLTKTYTGMDKTLTQSLESVRLCARYRDSQHSSLQSFLKQY